MSRTPLVSELLKMPEDYDYNKAIDEVQQLSSNYAVTFVAFNKQTDKMEVFGSGTLASIRGIKGILTADHVIELGIYRRHLSEFHICYRAAGGLRPFQDVKISQFDRVTVGKYSEGHEEEGPDLSFMTIIDDKLASSLGGIKSFHSLDDEFDVSNLPLTKMPWTISGSPQDFTVIEATDKGRDLLRISDYHMPALLNSYDKRGAFDYLKLHVNVGDEGPKDYEGVSGGGIWLVVLIGRDGVKTPVPSLQGVCYYATLPENGRAVLTGHGPDSIYKRLRAELNLL